MCVCICVNIYGYVCVYDLACLPFVMMPCAKGAASFVVQVGVFYISLSYLNLKTVAETILK